MKKFCLSILIIFLITNYLLSDTTDDYNDFGNFTNELVIYGTEETTQQIRTIKKEDINKLNPGGLPELLERSGSLSINKNGSFGNLSTVNIRGFTGGRVLILINGIPMNSTQTGTFDLSKVPVKDIEEIQIISGGSDTKYNYSGAIGGIINIITQAKKDPGFHIDGSISNLFYYPDFYFLIDGTKRFSKAYDFFDTQKVDLSFGIGNDTVRWEISGEGNRAYNHFIYKDNNNIKRRRINNEVWDGAGNTSFSIDLPYYMKLLLSGNFYYGNKNIPGPINTDNVGHQYEYIAGSSVFFDADYVGHEKIDTELIINYQFNRIDWADTLSLNLNTNNSIQVINKWGFMIAKWLTLSVGGDFKYNNLDSNTLGMINIFEGGGYITGLFSINGSAQIVPSVKLMYYEKYPVAVPKLGFVFYLGKYFTLKNNYFRLFKLPAVNDLYWPEDSFAKGNPELVHEDGVGGDVILGYDRKGILSAESSYFINYLLNGITWEPGSDGKWRPQNIGQAFYFGMDHYTKSDFSKYVTLEASYSFLLTYVLTNEFTFESDKRLPYKPMHTFGFGIYFNWKNGNINFMGHFESERYTTTLNVTELDPYFTFDINFSQTIKIVTIFASVKNAFSFFYYLIDGYPLPGGSVTMGVKLSYDGYFKKREE